MTATGPSLSLSMPRNQWIWKMPRNHMMSLKRKKKIHPLPIKNNVRARLGL